MFSEPTIKKLSDTNYQVSYGGDSSVFAQFFTDAVQDDVETAKQGRPIYKNMDMIKIMFPGNSLTVRIRPVRLYREDGQPSDPERFPSQWEAFKSSKEQVPDGTPIEQWPPIDKATAMNLKAMKIYTVEMLAGVNDNALNWMGSRQLRDNAKAWLEEAASGAETMRLRNELEALKQQMLAMSNQNVGFSSSKKEDKVVISEQAAPVLEAQHIKPIVTKMRGRPKKVANGTDTTTANEASGE